MSVTLALAGDTMLGRGVADELRKGARPAALFDDAVAATMRGADLAILNLECCISERGSQWPVAGKPFFFRAPPVAVEVLRHLGVGCVTLANNHALDYGPDALLDTLELLSDAGISVTGAGPDLERARAPAVLDASGTRIAVVGVTDHPEDFAAQEARPGVAFAELWSGVPAWLLRAAAEAGPDAVVVTPHWGPNMSPEPVPHVRDAARALVDAGAMLVAGHSAHVFHGIEGRILFDLGDFIDDYAVDPVRRNDLGLLFLVTLGDGGPERVEALPLRLEYAYTRVADGEDAAWIRERFRHACAAFGTPVSERDGLLVAG